MVMQKGFVTLAITSVLLVIALGYSLSSYRSVFYQIKVASNEVQARKDHWQAEGGLECAFSHIVNDMNTAIPAGLQSSCNWLGLSFLDKSGTDADVLVAKSGNSFVSKAINFGAASTAGAIRSTSDLVVFGSTLVSPPAPGPLNSDDEYECVTAVVSNYLIATGVMNSGVGTGIPKPSVDFDNSKDCAATHKTASPINSGIWKDGFGNHVTHNVLEDFKREEELNPFKDKFGYERSDWEGARDDTNFNFLSYTMSGSDIDCVSKFKDHLVLGSPNAVWITGSCQLNETALTSIKNLQSANTGTYLFLLIHNGVVGISGAGTIEGVMFHFNDGFAPNTSNWDSFDADIQSKMYFHGGPTNFDTLLDTLYPPSGLDPRLATYLQDGSFKFTGGMIYDTQGQIALFNNSLNLQYNSDIEKSFDFARTPKWKKGSWNDL